MAGKQCHKCGTWVSEEERLNGQCPSCGTFFESVIPVGVSNTPSSAGAPLIQTERLETPSARANRTSNAWSAWWVIPVAFFGIRGCSAFMRTMDNSNSDYNSHQRINEDELQRLLDRNRGEETKRYFEKFTMGPDDSLTIEEYQSAIESGDPIIVQSPETQPFEKLEMPSTNPLPTGDFENYKPVQD